MPKITKQPIISSAPQKPAFIRVHGRVIPIKPKLTSIGSTLARSKAQPKELKQMKGMKKKLSTLSKNLTSEARQILSIPSTKRHGKTNNRLKAILSGDAFKTAKKKVKA